MFVRKSTHTELQAQYLLLDHKYNEMVKEYNKIARWFNKHGGQQVIESKIFAPPAQFTKDEIKSLIRLCHPDKHDSSVAANEITKKLLALRG